MYDSYVNTHRSMLLRPSAENLRRLKEEVHRLGEDEFTEMRRDLADYSWDRAFDDLSELVERIVHIVREILTRLKAEIR